MRVRRNGGLVRFQQSIAPLLTPGTGPDRNSVADSQHCRAPPSPAHSSATGAAGGSSSCSRLRRPVRTRRVDDSGRRAGSAQFPPTHASLCRDRVLGGGDAGRLVYVCAVATDQRPGRKSDQGGGDRGDDDNVPLACGSRGDLPEPWSRYAGRIPPLSLAPRHDVLWPGWRAPNWERTPSLWLTVRAGPKGSIRWPLTGDIAQHSAQPTLI